MSRSTAGPEIERLIQLLARLPGLGPRSARRAALALVKKKDQLLVPLAGAMTVAAVLSRFPGAKIVDIQIRSAEEPEGLPSPAVPVDNPDEAPDPDDD